MISLIIFELKKTFLKPTIIIVVTLLLFVNLCSIYLVRKNNTYLDFAIMSADGKETFGDVYFDMYSDYSGEMNLDKITMLLEVYKPVESQVADLTASTAVNVTNTITGNVWSDNFFLNWMYITPMEYMWTYQSVAQDIVSSARQNITFYNKYNNTYKILENCKIIEIFKDRKIENFEYTEMVNQYLQYDFSSFLMIIILIFAITNIFIAEQESKTDTIILSSINGGTRTLLAKTIALMLFIVTLTIVYSLFDLMSFIAVYKTTEGLSLPIYATTNCQLSFFRGSVLEYAVLSFILKTVGMLSLGAMFLVTSLRLKNSLYVFMINFFASAIVIGLGLHFEKLTGGMSKSLNPYFLIFSKSVFSNCEFVKMFDVPVLIVVAQVISSLIILICFIAITVFTYPKNYHYRRLKA